MHAVVCRLYAAGLKIVLGIIRHVACNYLCFLLEIAGVTHMLPVYVYPHRTVWNHNTICMSTFNTTFSNSHFSMQPGWPGNCSHFWSTKSWYCWSYQLHVQYPWDPPYRGPTGTRARPWTTNPLFHERLSRNYTTFQGLPRAAQTLPVEQILCYLWGPKR